MKSIKKTGLFLAGLTLAIGLGAVIAYVVSRNGFKTTGDIKQDAVVMILDWVLKDKVMPGDFKDHFNGSKHTHDKKVCVMYVGTEVGPKLTYPHGPKLVEFTTWKPDDNWKPDYPATMYVDIEFLAIEKNSVRLHCSVALDWLFVVGYEFEFTCIDGRVYCKGGRKGGCA
jgi:hypothetical protein